MPCSNPAPAPAQQGRFTRRSLLALAAVGLLNGVAACASEAVPSRSPVLMSIVDRDSGQELSVYRKDGRGYVAGRPAARYAVRLSNRSNARVLVVLAVDGVNVISGQTAGWNQVGYVLDPWRTFDITGWRKSDTAIAAFEFAALADSYAARTGRPDNVGVIGMAVFDEKPAPPPEPPLSITPEVSGQPRRAEVPAPVFRRGAEGAAESSGQSGDRSSDQSRAKATASPSAPAYLADVQRLGTAHGRREWSAISHTAFERLSATPQAVVELAYDSWHNLVAAGVVREPAQQAAQQAAQARPFPLSPELPGYVPNPPLR